MADNNTMWEGLLAIIRALILGRRLPPEELRSFLLFAEPVAYLSAQDVAELLGDSCGHDLMPELPEGWTQGPAINDPDSGEGYDAHAQILGETLIGLLDKEHPEWKHEWHVRHCDEGYDFLSYRVLDARGKVHPIACYLEGKLKLMREGELDLDPLAKRKVICEFIERTLEWLCENAHDESETSGLPEEYREACDGIAAWVETMRSPEWQMLYSALQRCASHIYDSGNWAFDEWEGPWLYAPLLWDALQNLGYTNPEYHQPDRKQQQLFV